MCLPNILLPVFMCAFIFHCHSFSPCWPLAFLIFSPPLWIFMFFFLRNSSPLFSITRSSSFSVVHVNVNIKNNAEKDTTLLLFFLSKSPGGHVISFQIKPWVAFGLPYLLIELFYIGMPVVRTDGRAGGRCTVTWLPNFLGWVVYHIFYPWCFAARASRARAPLKVVLGLLAHVTPSFFFQYNPWEWSFSLQFVFYFILFIYLFFQNSRFMEIIRH